MREIVHPWIRFSLGAVEINKVEAPCVSLASSINLSRNIFSSEVLQSWTPTPPRSRCLLLHSCPAPVHAPVLLLRVQSPVPLIVLLTSIPESEVSADDRAKFIVGVCALDAKVPGGFYVFTYCRLGRNHVVMSLIV